MKMLNSLRIGILLFLGFGLNSQIFAKEFDDTMEKPFELAKPNNHRIFLRLLLGSGKMTTPPEEEIRGISNAATIASLFTSEPTLYASFFPNRDAGTTQEDIEYRYKDKFRIFQEKRLITKSLDYLSFDGGISSLPLDYSDAQRRLGVAYYHPVFPFLNLGVSLRQVELRQTTNSNIVTYFPSFTFGSGALLGNFSNNVANYKGYVPGLGLEYKPLRWFEVHYQYLHYNLTGNENLGEGGAIVAARGSLAIGTIGQGQVAYQGYSQTIDFVFRYSSWFATKWGYTTEKFLKRNTLVQFNSLVDDPAVNVLASLIGQTFTEASIKYSAVQLTFEFSKGFGDVDE